MKPKPSHTVHLHVSSWVAGLIPSGSVLGIAFSLDSPARILVGLTPQGFPLAETVFAGFAHSSLFFSTSFFTPSDIFIAGYHTAQQDSHHDTRAI